MCSAVAVVKIVAGVLQPSKDSPADAFEIFDAVCAAVGVRPGAERIGVFLELPHALQQRLWLEAANGIPTPEGA